MLRKFKDTHPDAHRLPKELNVGGQLVWFRQPREIGTHYNEGPIRYFVPADKRIPHQ